MSSLVECEGRESGGGEKVIEEERIKTTLKRILNLALF